VGHPADGERLTDAPAPNPKHDPLEGLSPLPAGLDDLDVDPNGVAGEDLWQILAELLLLDALDQINHVTSL
jgi:hypothetical protein